MSVSKIHALYSSLFGLLLVSLSYFVFYFLKDTSFVDSYRKIYFLLLTVSTWYFLILVFISDVRNKKYRLYNGEKIWVIMPVFNEERDLFLRAVDSIISAKGNKELIIINDGSKSAEMFEEVKKYSNVRVYHFEQNKGKREGLYFAIKKINSLPNLDSAQKNEYIVTVDSDTVLDENALIRIVEPLKDVEVGASTGDVQLLNEKENWLTRMVGTYYWIGLNFYKKAQSALGMVVCCSGCLAAYKKALLNSIIDQFVNQTFLGEKCTHSEDRHLTNLALQKGYKVVYVPEAISYTETPSTIKNFLKQQQRWKRGYIRESIYTLTWSWKTKKILFLEVLLWDLTMPFFTFGIHLVMIFTIIFDPKVFLTVILPSWILFMLVRYSIVFLRAPKKILGMFTYMLFYEIFLYWQNIYALFTVRNKSWITRG